jgi:hypothetical protein
MRISLTMRAARACVAATFVLSLGLAPSFAHMGAPAAAPFARPALGFGHFPHVAPRGFDRRFDFDRFSFDRFGLKRFDRFGVARFDRFGVNRFGWNGWNGSYQLGLTGWGWGGYWGGPDYAPTEQPAPIIVVGGPPVLISLNSDPGTRDGDHGYAGSCVIHKLIYDRDGKYVGERQSPQC